METKRVEFEGQTYEFPADKTEAVSGVAGATNKVKRVIRNADSKLELV